MLSSARIIRWSVEILIGTAFSLLSALPALQARAASVTSPTVHDAVHQVGHIAPSIRVQLDRTLIHEGGSVRATATVKGVPPDGNVPLWPYVNGRQWGAPEVPDRSGRAQFLLPLPWPGTARIQVALKPAAKDSWIWSHATRDNQTVYLFRRFYLAHRPTSSILYITADDSFTAFINGAPVAHGGNFHRIERASAAGLLHPGWNMLAVEAHNGSGPAGLLGLLRVDGNDLLHTDVSWSVSEALPAGWPEPTGKGGEHAVREDEIGAGPWGASLTGWPVPIPSSLFPVGKPLPNDATVSLPVAVRVTQFIHRVALDKSHRVGMDWEPWFTPLNVTWDTAEAVPLIGRYSSFDTDVTRQHLLWLDDAGVDFLLVDWSNNLWGKKHWIERDRNVDELIRATDVLFETSARMRAEGHSTPQIVLLLGLDNGPPTTMQAVEEEMAWVRQRYVDPARYRGLYLADNGRPLAVIFDGGGLAVAHGPAPDALDGFEVRWMASQLQVNHLERKGYWSWMDGVSPPVPTPRAGSIEALTITPAFFGDGGWTYPQARGRENGATYVEQFAAALKLRPRFLLLNQWNEFAGQPEGGGYGPAHNQYVDTYNVPLSDDIEPVSTTACAYRGCGGWGFYYQNLTRAFVDLYRTVRADQKRPRGILVVARPRPGEEVNSPEIQVTWSYAGAPPGPFELLLDGKQVLQTNGRQASIPTASLSPGWHRLIVRAPQLAGPGALPADHEVDPPVWRQPLESTVNFKVAAGPGGV